MEELHEKHQSEPNNLAYQAEAKPRNAAPSLRNSISRTSASATANMLAGTIDRITKLMEDGKLLLQPPGNSVTQKVTQTQTKRIPKINRTINALPAKKLTVVDAEPSVAKIYEELRRAAAASAAGAAAQLKLFIGTPPKHFFHISKQKSYFTSAVDGTIVICNAHRTLSYKNGTVIAGQQLRLIYHKLYVRSLTFTRNHAQLVYDSMRLSLSDEYAFSSKHL
ncbi:hypothetical protein CCUS01_02444 [Colletotrichum cuscutae]|uniref:Uncharacterized protein n=1 Tax=Colletotrichum cuscutae TaxID=1209917 RepID=A0AAI9TVX4_9PEZI|nr:hypothetical protein CCUS01_02444 [Colletotrichum cuscutae]